MKIGVMSDIHGNSPALEAVLPVLFDETDQVLFLGDLCGYYPFVEECVALWDHDRIVGVRGNHDQLLLDCLQSHASPPPAYQTSYGSALTRTLQRLSPSSVSLLQSLPVSRTLHIEGRVLALYHGTPWDPLNGRLYPDDDRLDQFASIPAEIILLGHTHYPFTKRYQDKLIMNPGSVGQPRDRGGGACAAIVDVATGEVEHRRVPYDPRRLIEDARQHDPEVPYLVNVLTR